MKNVKVEVDASMPPEMIMAAVKQVNEQLIKALMGAENGIRTARVEEVVDRFTGITAGLSDVVIGIILSGSVSMEMDEEQTLGVVEKFKEVLEEGVREGLTSPQYKAVKAYRDTLIAEAAKNGDPDFRDRPGYKAKKGGHKPHYFDRSDDPKREQFNDNVIHMVIPDELPEEPVPTEAPPEEAAVPEGEATSPATSEEADAAE